jgi:quinol monooxygenase YgiN
MASSPIRVVARFAVKPECVDDFIEAARRTLVEPTVGEPGCLLYDLCQDEADPTRFAMVEAWESAEALDAHLAQESLQQAVGALMPMAAEPPQVWRLRSVSRSD